jgi:hypothetical protein
MGKIGEGGVGKYLRKGESAKGDEEVQRPS